MTRMERQVKFTWLPLNREEEKMMKARYQKPMIEIEKYALDSAIAAGCQTVISLGPGDDIHPICDEYEPEKCISAYIYQCGKWGLDFNRVP